MLRGSLIAISMLAGARDAGCCCCVKGGCLESQEFRLVFPASDRPDFSDPQRLLNLSSDVDSAQLVLYLRDVACVHHGGAAWSTGDCVDYAASLLPV